MEAFIVLAITFVLLWVLFIFPQQRRVRAHQQLVASIEPGDEVVLSAGIFGRIVDLDAEEILLEVAPGVELRVARQAVLRRVESITDQQIEQELAEEDAELAEGERALDELADEELAERTADERDERRGEGKDDAGGLSGDDGGPRPGSGG